MVQLVWLPAKGRPPGTAAFWFNPDHVIALTPRFNDAGASVTLYVRMKLQGLPEGDYWLGDFESMSDADTGWQDFLARLT
ncbi:hypothetical protein [Herbiconiux ginsengi]|uniref:Uncharacterized protein n=1 Tax=Herbiconiux ginsengi TaxID=381665 RepID=A0A1H3TDZ5_9MICO|nr:hypothetical protein [Herbiconiux ginsengi]SDZ48320.1 hypothetical protein SAMN05216554_4112 [Herbiconiux ginsengi]